MYVDHRTSKGIVTISLDIQVKLDVHIEIISTLCSSMHTNIYDYF